MKTKPFAKMLLGIIVLALPVLECISGQALAGVSAQFPARTIRHAAGKIGSEPGSGIMDNIKIPPANEYYLDYTFTVRAGFDWIPNHRPRGGKLPGLAGGAGTGGCTPIVADGWSARQMWHEYGFLSLYLYHQDRKSRCGDNFSFLDAKGKPFQAVTGKQYRLTERVKINTPNAFNGEVQVWIDGRQVILKTGIRLRGKVGPTQAIVSQVKYHSYFGGSTFKFAPSRDSFIDYGAMYVTTCAPSFAKAPGTCR